MTRCTLTVWLLDYDVDTGEIEFHYCDKNEWNGVKVTAAQAEVMQDEFTRTGRTTWTGTDDSIEFVRGDPPVDFEKGLHYLRIPGDLPRGKEKRNGESS